MALKPSSQRRAIPVAPACARLRCVDVQLASDRAGICFSSNLSKRCRDEVSPRSSLPIFFQFAHGTDFSDPAEAQTSLRRTAPGNARCPGRARSDGLPPRASVAAERATQRLRDSKALQFGFGLGQQFHRSTLGCSGHLCFAKNRTFLLCSDTRVICLDSAGPAMLPSAHRASVRFVRLLLLSRRISAGDCLTHARNRM